MKIKLSYIIIGIAVLVIFVLGFFIGTSQKKSAKPEAPSLVSSPQTIESPATKVHGEKAPLAVPAEETVQGKEKSALSVPETLESAVVSETAGVEAVVAIKPEFQKGMIYVAWTQEGYDNANSVKSMEQMKSIGVDWTGLVTTWYQDQYNSTQISSIPDKTPSDQSLVAAIRKLHELKIKVMLKPHLDIVKGEGKWRGDIAMDNPEDWQKWFDSYTNYIMHYANIAAKEKVELFCLGTELTQATLGHPQYWRELIKKIRQVYKGGLTYAANWNEEFNKIEFWDALDYAGIDPYFPLVCTNNPKVDELKSAWDYWVKDMDAWHNKIKKPVILAEIGYKSSADATDEPWQHVGMGKLDLELQSNCYQALMEVFWDKPWFYGAYWWYWGVHPKMGGPLNKGFTPQNKPAQEIIKEWYLNKPVPQKNIESEVVIQEETAPAAITQ